MSRRELIGFQLPTPAPAADHWLRVHRRAMACRFDVTLSGEDEARLPAARDALLEAERVEDRLSVFRESELVRLNREAGSGPVVVDEELFGLLLLCRELYDATRGAFDVSSTPLSRCWGFLKRQGRLPAEAEIGRALEAVGLDGVELDPATRSVSFRRPRMELNMGSIGKGHALGRMGARLRRHGVVHALLSAGGSSVLALGGRDGGWSIDIRSRRAPGAPLARLRLREGALATSGSGEQFVEIAGRRYGHVLDPRTGWPAAATLSVSVVCARPAVADALSTAFCVGGSELAQSYCESHPGTLAVVTPDDGTGRPHVFGSYDGAKLEGA